MNYVLNFIMYKSFQAYSTRHNVEYSYLNFVNKLKACAHTRLKMVDLS